MHRCWLDAPASVGDAVTLSPEEAAHVSRVLRMRAGERVQLIAQDRLFDAELLAVGESVTARVLAELPSPESRARITLVQGLPKGDKLELILQKATELGAWDVWIVETERSIAKADASAKKSERWRRIALEAAKQSGRAHVPTIAALSMTEALARLQSDFDAVFVAWEDERALHLSEAVAKRPTLDRAALLIGPEGGLSPNEIERLRAIGAESVTLGKRILRTETAGLCGLAVMLTALGEM